VSDVDPVLFLGVVLECDDHPLNEGLSQLFLDVRADAAGNVTDQTQHRSDLLLRGLQGRKSQLL
jgi:hypothetical protein